MQSYRKQQLGGECTGAAICLHVKCRKCSNKKVEVFLKWHKYDPDAEHLKIILAHSTTFNKNTSMFTLLAGSWIQEFPSSTVLLDSQGQQLSVAFHLELAFSVLLDGKTLHSRLHAQYSHVGLEAYFLIVSWENRFFFLWVVVVEAFRKIF